MASRLLANLGLRAFWGTGFTPWGDENDRNLLQLDTVTQLNVQTYAQTLPASPPAGSRYIAPSNHPTNPNEIAVFDNGAYVFFAPQVGWRAFVFSTARYMFWTGIRWEFDTYRGRTSVTGPFTANVGANNEGSVYVLDNAPGAITLNFPQISTYSFTVVTEFEGFCLADPATNACTIQVEAGATLNGVTGGSCTLLPGAAYRGFQVRYFDNDAYYVRGDISAVT